MSDPADSPSASRDVFRLPGYLAFWTAETVSAFGTYVTTLALQVLVVVSLRGSATDVGLVSAARWLPYLLFGLIVGALVDRWRRKPVLVATDLARAVFLIAIPALWLAGWLTLPVLMIFVALFGLMTLLNDAASQSFLPRLTPPIALLAANARLDQGAATAQATGPVLAGALVAAIGAPLAVLVDAASYLISAVMIAGLPVSEPQAARRSGGEAPTLRQDIAEGLRWIYRHPMLAPQAVSTHVWFLCNSLLTTVLAPFVLTGLHLGALDFGLVLAAAGAASLVGSLFATRLGLGVGAGWAVIACRALMPAAWAPIACAPDDWGRWPTLALLCAGQGLVGLAMGASNANEMGYRQAATPDALQARMNTTQRSINRGMIVIGAPLGGLLADGLGYRTTLWLGIAGFALGAAGLALTPFRRARHGDRQTPAAA